MNLQNNMKHDFTKKALPLFTTLLQNHRQIPLLNKKNEANTQEKQEYNQVWSSTSNWRQPLIRKYVLNKADCLLKKFSIKLHEKKTEEQRETRIKLWEWCVSPDLSGENNKH